MIDNKTFVKKEIEYSGELIGVLNKMQTHMRRHELLLKRQMEEQMQLFNTLGFFMLRLPIDQRQPTIDLLTSHKHTLEDLAEVVVDFGGDFEELGNKVVERTNTVLEWAKGLK